MELLPMRQAEECQVRQIIDAAAALALGVDGETLADWRWVVPWWSGRTRRSRRAAAFLEERAPDLYH